MFTAAIKPAACELRSGCVRSPWVTDGMTAHWRIETHSSPHMYTHCTHRIWVVIHPLSNIKKYKYHLLKMYFWIFENNHTSSFKRIFATYICTLCTSVQPGQKAVWAICASLCGMNRSETVRIAVVWGAQHTGIQGMLKQFWAALNIMNSNYQSS